MRFEGYYRLLDYDSVEPDGAIFENAREQDRPAFTIPYVSPEVARAVVTGEPLALTCAADVWSCGLVLFELFTGEQLLRDEKENIE